MNADHQVSRYSNENGFYTLAVVEMEGGIQRILTTITTDNSAKSVDMAWESLKTFLQEYKINYIPFRNWLYSFEEYPKYFNGLGSPHQHIWSDELVHAVFGAEAKAMKEYGFKNQGLLFY